MLRYSCENRAQGVQSDLTMTQLLMKPWTYWNVGTGQLREVLTCWDKDKDKDKDKDLFIGQ